MGVESKFCPKCKTILDLGSYTNIGKKIYTTWYCKTCPHKETSLLD